MSPLTNTVPGAESEGLVGSGDYLVLVLGQEPLGHEGAGVLPVPRVVVQGPDGHGHHGPGRHGDVTVRNPARGIQG